MALPYVPADVATEVRRWRRHYVRSGRCLLCDQLSSELEAGRRIVLHESGLVLYVPFGTPFSGEMVLAPERHQASFETESDGSLSHVSQLLLSAVQRLRSAFDDPDFNLVLQTWPKGSESDAALHWRLRIIARQAVLGGFELSTGDFVSTLTPEKAAQAFRNT